jgi:mRNA interferase MazF
VTPPVVRRGEVWIADIPNDKIRPVLVLSRNPMGRILRSVICAPITSKVRGLGAEVPIGPSAGLDHDSVANFDATLLLERDLLIRNVGKVDLDTMAAACRALAFAIGCDG